MAPGAAGLPRNPKTDKVKRGSGQSCLGRPWGCLPQRAPLLRTRRLSLLLLKTRHSSPKSPNPPRTELRFCLLPTQDSFSLSPLNGTSWREPKPGPTWPHSAKNLSLPAVHQGHCCRTGLARTFREPVHSPSTSHCSQLPLSCSISVNPEPASSGRLLHIISLNLGGGGSGAIVISPLQMRRRAG